MSGTKNIIIIAALLIMAFISGLMLSSFVIGDRNLPVTLIAIAFPALTLWLSWKKYAAIEGKGKWTLSLYSLLCAIAGFIFSIKGIC